MTSIHTATDAEQAYARFTEAVEEHKAVCLSFAPESPDRYAAAMAVSRRWIKFLKVAGGPQIGEPSQSEKNMRASIWATAEKLRSADAMLFGIQSIGAFDFLPDDKDRHQPHEACCSLLSSVIDTVADALSLANAQ